MKYRGLLAAYVVSDWLAGAASWTVLFVYRKVMFEQAEALDAALIASDGRYQLGWRWFRCFGWFCMPWRACT